MLHIVYKAVLTDCVASTTKRPAQPVDDSQTLNVFFLNDTAAG